jgi:hypothetical protein
LGFCWGEVRLENRVRLGAMSFPELDARVIRSAERDGNQNQFNFMI